MHTFCSSSFALVSCTSSSLFESAASTWQPRCFCYLSNLLVQKRLTIFLHFFHFDCVPPWSMLDRPPPVSCMPLRASVCPIPQSCVCVYAVMYLCLNVYLSLYIYIYICIYGVVCACNQRSRCPLSSGHWQGPRCILLIEPLIKMGWDAMRCGDSCWF